MATTTTLNGTITAGATKLTLTAFTNPSTGQISGKTMLKFTTGEKCLVTDASLSPTLEVVRGYEGTTAVAHTTLEAVQYGLMGDTAFTEANTFVGQADIAVPSFYRIQTQQVTATGSTGSTAANVTAGPMAAINTTGATDAGVNLWVPVPGDVVIIHNDSTTGAVKFYSLGATINGTTGTTAVSITATGTKGVLLVCYTAGAWTSAIAST
jgi:hypothetical protein